jgi:hypothetical protein
LIDIRPVDDGGVGLGDRVVVKAEVVDLADAEVLDNDVGPRGEVAGDCGTLRVLEVEGEGAFAAVGDEGMGGFAVLGLAERAGPVAGAGRFELDDVGAVAREEHASIGAGDALGEIQYDDILEGQAGFVHECCLGGIMIE